MHCNRNWTGSISTRNRKKGASPVLYAEAGKVINDSWAIMYHFVNMEEVIQSWKKNGPKSIDLKGWEDKA